MSSKSKSQLRTENSNNFPNNNSQFITPEKLRGFNNDIIDSLVVSSDTGSYVTTSSFDDGTRIQTFTKADGTTYTNTISGGSQDTGSLLVTSSFNNSTRLQTFTKGDGSTYTNSIPLTTINTGSFVITGSVSNATSTFTKGDGSTFGLTVNNVVNATSASHAELADLATLATNATNAVTASKVTDPNIAYINKNNTFTGTQSFNNISVSGTGSFGRINSVTGSAKIIGDAFIVLNADTPTSRYAGIQVYDTGSASTASIEWDGVNDSWILIEEGGQSSFLLTAPTGSKGSEVNLTNNTLTKAGVHRQLVDSNITDDGSTVSITGDLSVSGEYKGFDSSSFAILNQSNTFTGGIQLVSGSNGFVKQQFTAPGTDAEKAFFEVSDAQIDGVGYNRVFYGMADYPSYGKRYEDYLAIEYYQRVGFNYLYGSEFNINGVATALLTRPSGSAAADYARLETFDDGDTTSTANITANDITIGTSGNVNTINIGKSSADINVSAALLISSAPISSSNFISASAFIGNGAQLTGIEGGIFVETGSFYATTNNLQVTGSFNVSKAIGGKNTDLSIASNTASIDLTQSNTYTVTLVDSADTHLDVSTFGGNAQSINILVKQPASGNTGSISFSSDFKFGGGYNFTPTPALSAEDIISFTRFGSSLYGTYINNFN